MSSLNAALAGVRDQLHAGDGGGGGDDGVAASSRGGAPSARKVAAPAPSASESNEPDDSAPIQVYCRIRPSRKGAIAASSTALAVDPSERRVEFTQQSSTSANARESHKFDFTGLFPEETTQAQIFDAVGKRVVDNVISGYHGTLFAYGQTGSGKTYTMMGGDQHYDDRGLIPRALTYIFDWVAANTAQFSVAVRISYLEIYNDKGYDLLDPQHEHKTLEDLPRVTLLESDGQVHFRNLGELPAATVDEALNLLFVGDTNRVVCSTPSNDASTRSHCIFTVSLETRSVGGSKVRRSKLNLVDLAGSERVKKTGVLNQAGGKILNEALHINVSLHYLEQVIVALHEAASGKATHIPYRNSMLTSVLRDSLGGSCRTAMIATLSPERGHMDESISTSRFAMRVSAIKNHAHLNEETDPHVLVKTLKAQLREVREELAQLRGQASFQPLDAAGLAGMRDMVRLFVRDDHADIFETEGRFDQLPMPNPYKVRAAFEAWKEMLLEGGNGAAPTTGATKDAAPMPNSAATNEELACLKRENAMLTDALLQRGGKDGEQVIAQIRARSSGGGGSKHSSSGDKELSTHPSSSRSASSTSAALAAAPSMVTPAPAPQPTAAELALAQQRAESFESFRRSYRKHALVEEQKQTHALKVDAARKLGESINAVRGEINTTKQAIEAHRLARGVEQLSGTATDQPLPPDAEEMRLHSRIDSLKQSYRGKFDELTHLKAEVDYLKNAVQKSRAQLQADFERWWATQPAGQQAAQSQPPQSQGQQQDAPQRQPKLQPQQQPPAAHAPRLIADAASVASGSYSSSQQPSSSSSRRPPTEAWGAAPSTSSSRHAAVEATAAQPMPSNLRTTGNSAADADIAKFYEMKQQMLDRQQKGQR